MDSLTPTATSTSNEQTGDTIMTKSNTNKQKREPKLGETSPSFPPPKSYQFVTPDQTQETNNPTKKTRKGTVAEETEKSTIGTKITTNSNSTGQTAKVNGQNLTKLETLRNVTKTVEKLKLEAKMQAEELDATHEERFRNKRVRGKDNVTKNPSQYEKENSGVAIRSKEKAGNENKPIDISDSTLVQELSKHLSQEHLPSLADIEINKEKRLVSPIGFESDIETPRAAEQTATDYTGISIDIPLIGKENVSGGFEIANKELINFSLSKIETPIETEKLLSTDDTGTVPDVASEISKLFDEFLRDNPEVIDILVDTISKNINENFAKDAHKLLGTKIAAENRKFLTEILDLLKTKTEEVKSKDMIQATMTELLAQYGIGGTQNGQLLNSIKETLAEIKDKEDNEFRGQPNIIHFDVGRKIEIEDWLEKFKDVMNDKRASIDKQVSQLKLLTDGAANAWIKDKLKAMKYEEKKMSGELTYEWFEELLKRMKDQFTNLNPWTGELNFQSLKPKVSEDVQEFYSRVYLEGRKLDKSDQDIANVFLRGLPISYQYHVLNQKPQKSSAYMEAAQTYESMCRLGGAEGALVQPDTIKIATISGISPLNETITATTTAVDEKARQMITELSEALKIMGRSIDKNENDNKQLRKEIKIDHGNKNLNFSNYGSAVVMCSHCNELGHTEDICQTHTAYDWNNIQGNGNYDFTK